jgi:hypothetical protein
MVDDTLSARYEQTMSRLAQIAQAGYEVEVHWEWAFERDILPSHLELKTLPIVKHSPLKTRDSHYGGRTEAMRLHYEIGEGQETIQYVDVMSLYAYVCKFGKFPIGHLLYTWETRVVTDSMLQMEGLIKCLVLPPRRLYHPVLPFRSNGRLLFCLWKTCASEQNSVSECTHESVRERALLGTWVVDEVRLAVQKGYRVLEVLEMYQYEVTQYDRQTWEGVCTSSTSTRYSS